jgi:membrane-associated phospholipid phosphatase
VPFLVLLLVALTAGVAVFLVARHYPGASSAPEQASEAAGEQLAEQAVRHDWIARLLRGRLDPETATGLALTLAFVVVVLGGLLVGVLAYLVRSSGDLIRLDRSVGSWGHDHATKLSTDLLQLVTDLASTPAAIIVVIAVGTYAMVRAPSRWVPPFLLTVLIGEVVIVNTIKHLLHRVRPTFNPIAAHLGPSFPSGHSATAAALYASAALVLARRRPPLVRAILAGTAAGIAVAVACSRVMLGVHWMSDVIAGLAFGWAWFAVCAIAFGGRFLNFGAPVEEAARVAERLPDPDAARSGSEVVEVALQRPEQPAAAAGNTGQPHQSVR